MPSSAPSRPSRRSAARFLPSLAALAAVLGAVASPARALEVAFSVSMPRPWTHLAEVEMRVTGADAAAKTADLAMPVWTPGSYVLREYARNVQDFAPADAAGKALTWRKFNKNTWRVDTSGATAFTARYKVYLNSLKVQEAEVTDAHAFWNNAAVLMHVSGGLNAPATLSIAAPSGWKVATGLPAVAGSSNTFRAPNFDVLYDSPVDVAPFTETTFTVRGVPHRIVIDGPAPSYPTDRVRQDFQKIVEAESAMLGDLPYANYTFLILVRSGFGGGLEHLNSTAIGTGPEAFYNGAAYEGLLETVAHEFFHLWNVKRIKPDALGPFDYNRENHTRLLWVAEGLTSYYEAVFLRRAGLQTPNRYLADLARQIGGLENTPGRREMSLEESSFDAWIKQYKPDENSVNSTVSYYSKGALVGALLDLTIRQRSGGAKSLDDVMRALYADFAKAGKNYTPADFQRVSEQAAGGSLEPFFAKYVRGREELDFAPALSAVGLRLRRTPPGLQPLAFLGGRLDTDPAGVRLVSVPSDSPAYEQGLAPGDVILAMDDLRVTAPNDFQARIVVRQPGDTVRLTLFRNDQLKTVTVKLGSRPFPDYRILPAPNSTAEQKRLYRDWIGAEFPARGEGE